MVEIPLGTGDWSLPSEDVPRLPLHNMYIVENLASPDGLSRVSRPTLSPYATVGTGPIYGVWRQDATFGGDWLVVSANQLYRFDESLRASTLLGSVPGSMAASGYCQFAGTADRVLMVRNGVCYSTDGATLSAVVLPDDVPGYEGLQPPVQSVAVINSTFILTIKDTQRFYWINPGETDPDPLDFASAERLPDSIESVNILQDEVWFVGTSGPEVWSTTTDPEFPFARINGRVYNDGCRSRDTVVEATSNSSPCLLWVTNTDSVVMAQGSLKRISDNSVEEALRTSTNLRAWSFKAAKHDFYVLTADEFTYAYDLNRGEWSMWDSYLKANFRAHLGVQSGSKTFAVSLDGSSVWELVDGSDDDGDPVIRRVYGVLHNPGKPVQCASVAVRVNAGWSPTYDFFPNLEMRWSDDQATTWSDYVQISLGNKGRYDADTIFRSLGLIRRPGRVFEFRYVEKTRFRLDYAVMNEV